VDWNLRRCQREPLTDWATRQPEDFLAVLTPGAGKTRFAAAVARGAIDSGLVQRAHVIVPTTALKRQWALEFYGTAELSLEPRYRTGARLASDRNGCVVTYAQLLERPHVFARLFENALTIHDEIHHAGEDSTWGQCLEEATGHTKYRLHLSGTPFRSDRTKIAHLRYDQSGLVIPDYIYGYREALDDGIVRPIVAHPQGGMIKWRKGSDGSICEAAIDDPRISGRDANERLRGLLNDRGWLQQVITRSDALLTNIRKRGHPDAGALIACIDEKHARLVESVVEDALGIAPVVVVSADPDADATLERYRKGNERWLIAIRKVSEGIDIPRLREELYLTNARTPLIFRQLAGRIVRARQGDNRPSYLIYPADPTFSALVRDLEAEIRGEADVTDKPAAAPPLAIDDGEGGGTAPVDVIDVAYVELDPYVAVQATVDPDALFAPQPVATEGRTTPQHDDHERLHRVLNGVIAEVSHRFDLTKHDIYAYWKGLRGSLESATTVELQRRINAMRRWLEDGKHPVKKRYNNRKAAR
jgi:superfamily II DNA or RNA helicase